VTVGPGWTHDPRDPFRDGDLLFGRGSADDGYASFSVFTALKVVQD
jgi:acetylornithine deacetylase/succinyl-diaminopimelate desuccinylase-like protein